MSLEKSLRNFGAVLTTLFLLLYVIVAFPVLYVIPLFEVVLWLAGLSALWFIALRDSSEYRIIFWVWSAVYTGFFVFTLLTMTSEILGAMNVSLLFLAGAINFWYATERLDNDKLYYRATLLNLVPLAAYFFVEEGFLIVAILTQALPILQDYRRKN